MKIQLMANKLLLLYFSSFLKWSRGLTAAHVSYVGVGLPGNTHSLLALDVLTQIMPSLHGFYRAISSTSFSWSLSQWQTLTLYLRKLCSPSIIDRLNHLAVDILQKENADANTFRHVQTLVSRYVAQGRPLSGYFVVCCVLETEWTVLAQALAPPMSTRSPVVEAAAANKVWLSLTRSAARELEIEDQDIKDLLKLTIKYAMQCFTDLLTQIEEMEVEPVIDTYAWETMSESLVSNLFSMPSGLPFINLLETCINLLPGSTGSRRVAL
jgi:phosphatidylinositol 4-kinase